MLLVESYECITSLRRRLQDARCAVPPMLSYNLIQPFNGEVKAGEVDMRGRSAMADRLQQAACEGADPPLAMALPHTRALLYRDAGGGARVIRSWVFCKYGFNTGP